MSSRMLPSSLRPSVASEPAIGVRSALQVLKGLGVRGPGGTLVLFSKRLNASPNLPASNVLVPDKDIDGRLERLISAAAASSTVVFAGIIVFYRF